MSNPNIPHSPEGGDDRYRIHEVLGDGGLKAPQQLFEDLIRPKIHELVMKLSLVTVIEESRGILNGTRGSQTEREKRAAEHLMKGFFTKKSLFNNWAFFPDIALKEGVYDTTLSVMLMGILLNHELGIETEYVTEPRHAYGMATLGNMDIYFLDPKNHEVNQIHPPAPEVRGVSKIYYPNGHGHNSFLVSPIEFGATMDMFSKMLQLRKATGSDPEAQRISDEYCNVLDFDNAERYIKQFGI